MNTVTTDEAVSGDLRPVPGTVEADVIRHAVEAKLFGRAVEPRRIDHFVLLSTAGAGGMGIVYRAYDPDLQREVALKLVRPELVVGPGGSAERAMAHLMKEARAAARVAHPNVAVVHQVGMVSGAVYIAMEFVEGTTLRQWCAHRPPRAWRETLAMYLAAGEGLAAAHRVGVVHRDFKPDNVLVGADARPRVTDFGLAVADVEQATHRVAVATSSLADGLESWTDGARGTPAYMSPEQHCGADVGEASDQFSFCGALWEALSGSRPYEGETRRALRAAVTVGDRRPFQGEGVPKALTAALVRGLDPDPKRRFASMDALLVELRRVAKGQAGNRRGAMLAVAAMASAGVAYAATRDEPRPCDGGAARVADVWNAARRGTINAAFGQTGKVFAEASASRTAEILDAYAHDWAEGYAEICAAAIRRGKPRAGPSDPRMACMERGLTVMDAFVTELVAPDATVLARAVSGAAGLPKVQHCVQARHLPSPPVEGGTGRAEAIEHIHREVARAQGLALAGRYDRSLVVAQQAANSASELGDAAAEAVAWQLLGHYLAIAGKPAASAALEHAFQAALASGDDVQAARAAIAMIQAVDKHAETSAEADVWSGRASALIARIDSEQLLEIDRLQQVGENAIARGDAKRALRNFEAALAIANEREIEPATRASLNVRLAKAESVTGAWDDAENHVSAALVVLTDSLGPQHPRIAELHNLLGTIDAARQRPSAYDHFSDAVAILDLADPDSEATAFAHANLGTFARKLGRYDESRRELQKAKLLFVRATGPEHRAIPGIMIALAQLALDQGELASARVVFEEVVARPDGAYRDYALEGLAVIYEKQGELVRALAFERRALAIRDKAGRIGEVVTTTVSVAQLLFKLERLDEAAAAAEVTLETIGATPSKDLLSAGRAHTIVGEVRLQQERHADASQAFDEALAAWAGAQQVPVDEVAHVKLRRTQLLCAEAGPSWQSAFREAESALAAVAEPDPAEVATLEQLRGCAGP